MYRTIDDLLFMIYNWHAPVLTTLMSQAKLGQLEDQIVDRPRVMVLFEEGPISKKKLVKASTLHEKDII